MGPGPMANVFGQVMGTPGQVPQNSAPAKVYASVYSGVRETCDKSVPTDEDRFPCSRR
jgi:hypothetical protein